MNAMLLNEFLKEHKKVGEQQTNITQLNSKMANQAAIIAQQQRGIELLTVQLKEQAPQIVSHEQQPRCQIRRVFLSGAPVSRGLTFQNQNTISKSLIPFHFPGWFGSNEVLSTQVP